MDYDSVLNGSALAAQCRELVDCLKQENSFYEYELTAITAYIESESLGEAADRLRDKSAELIQTIKTMITANEYDIHDLNLLSDFVDGINIDGYEVLTRMKEAIRNADDCNEQAEAYYHMALSCPIGSISDYYYDLSKSYHSYADSWERIADTLHKIELQYDEINYESSCLFIKGNSIRNVINLASPTTSNTYTLLKQPINTSSITKANSRTDEIYKFVYDYLTNRGFSEEQINYLYKNKYSLFSSLYVTAYRSTADCPTVIKNMSEQCMNFEKKYSFLTSDLANKLNISEKEAEKYLYQLEQHKLDSLWDTYHYSSPDYWVILENIVTDDFGWCGENEKIDLVDIVAYRYCAIENTGDIVTDLGEERYQNMLEERSKLPLHGWPSWEYTNGLGDLGNYYSQVGIPYELDDSKLTVKYQGKKCDKMEIYEKNKYLVDSEGRYLITVGPKVLCPDYDVNNDNFDISDFVDFIGCEIDVVLVDDEDSSNVITLECIYGGDIKAHTDGWGEGICMSGIRYENATSAGEKYAEPDGSFIEFFATPSNTGPMSGYSVKKIIVRQ